jgi:YVTN family beta-propeller protein
MNRGRQPERFLATILFTDIVGSTDLAAEIGDAKWRRLLASHHAAVRKQLKAFGGREVDTAGDGFLCSFDQPAQAVRAADAILRDVARLGLTLRAGIHTGECERVGGKIGGIAVHIAARVMAAAAPGEILVSSTVRDLVAGSQLDFEDAGSHELKGVPGEWHLYRLLRQPVDEASAATPGADSTEDGVSSGRRLWPIAAFIGVLALLLVVAGLAVANGFGVAKPPPVGVPNSVAVLDAATGNLVDVHQVPQGPVAIAYDDGGKRLWVASLDAGVVTDFAIAGGGADGTTGRVGRPTDLAVGGGSVWVADAFNATVTLIDVGTGDPQKTVSNVHARQLAYGFDSAWATDDIADRLNRLDRQSGEVAQSIELGPGDYPTGLAVDVESIWVGNVGTSTVSRVDPVTASVSVAGIALRQVPAAMAAGSTGVWITSRESDATLRMDTATNSVSQTIAVADQPVAIGVDAETVWIGCAGPHEVWHLGIDGTVLSKTFVAGVPTDIVIVDGRVYVTVAAS